MLDAVLPPGGFPAIKRNSVRANELSRVLEGYKGKIKVLSLDCFDTLLWRQTSSPKDIFALLAERPLAQSLGLTAHQRLSAAAQAYRNNWVREASKQIRLIDVYRNFTSLSVEQQEALAEEELQTEIDHLYAFSPCTDLIRQAHNQGLKIIVVSDIYYTEKELRRILTACLPQDINALIQQVFCSTDYGKSKTDGLFLQVVEKLKLDPQMVLHIGDHAIADCEAPLEAGLRALHFMQLDKKTIDFLRLQSAASALTLLQKPRTSSLLVPRFSPFKALFSLKKFELDQPATSVGYMSFGPILYTFSRFLFNEVEVLQNQGKSVKVFFLLRDAFLLSCAAEAYAGKPFGKFLRIRKFIAVAASFKTREDIDYYLSSIKPEHYHLWVIGEQLLLPPDLIKGLIQQANTSADPQAAFHQLLHQESIMQLIFERSSACRRRLKKYMLKEMNLEPGDTVLLVDTGYIGVTQSYLARTFEKELNIEILGRYVLGSDEPNYPHHAKALITTTWCDHALFEQSCTYQEGTVLDYDEAGNPILDKLKLSEAQYQSVKAIQGECLRFIGDARDYFKSNDHLPHFSILKSAAHAALKRHIFLPLEEELGYFSHFQLDKDMGPDLKKTVYNIPQAWSILQRVDPPHVLNPYEARALSSDLALSMLLQRGLQLELKAEDLNIRFTPIKVVLIQGKTQNAFIEKALYKHDGYYSLTLPCVDLVYVGLVFGEFYHWVQIDEIAILNQQQVVAHVTAEELIFDKMISHGSLFESQSKEGWMLIKPRTSLSQLPLSYRIIFRPLNLRL